MARVYRAASYLLRRGASWYFRLRLPAQTQSVARRSELHLKGEGSLIRSLERESRQRPAHTESSTNLTSISSIYKPDLLLTNVKLVRSS